MQHGLIILWLGLGWLLQFQTDWIIQETGIGIGIKAIQC